MFRTEAFVSVCFRLILLLQLLELFGATAESLRLLLCGLLLGSSVVSVLDSCAILLHSAKRLPTHSQPCAE